MSVQFKPISQLASICKVIFTRFHKNRVPVQAILPGLQPPARPWYIAILFKCIETLLITLSSIALGTVFVVILHYLGIDGSMNPHP